MASSDKCPNSNASWSNVFIYAVRQAQKSETGSMISMVSGRDRCSSSTIANTAAARAILVWLEKIGVSVEPVEISVVES